MSRILILAILALCLAATPTLAQEAAPVSGATVSVQPPQKVEVFRLAHADPADICTLLSSLFRDPNFTAIPEMRTGQIVVRASADTIAGITTLLPRLDIPVEAGQGSQRVTAVLEPKHRPVRAVMESVRIHLGPSGQYAVDEQRNLLVIRDNPDAVAAARSILADLDEPKSALELDFHVLGRGGSSLDAAGFGDDVRAEIRALGLEGYGVVSRAVVKTMDWEKWRIEENSPTTELELRGRTIVQADGNSVEMQLSFQLQQEASTPETGSDNTGAFRGVPRSRVDLDTTLQVPIGHHSIIGLAPTGNEGEQAEPLVLVVRVKKGGSAVSERHREIRRK